MKINTRTFLSFEAQYIATAEGHGFEESFLRSFYSAIYHRETLNYGIPYAGPTFKVRGETDFTRWFEAHIESSH